MGLATGTHLGPYEVTAKIGVGGMGEVYRASDTNLNRDVALKVLPDVVADDPDRLARFTREAQTLAALNHPNIAHIHGLEESGGVRALVMELVEGEDLADASHGAPIPLDEALPIAKQIAEALEAAHEQRHRPSRSQAGEHQGSPRRHGEGARLRPRKGAAQTPTAEGAAALADSPTITSPAMTAGGHDSRDRRLHGARTGARDARSTSARHLGVWLRALRDADGCQGVQG